MLATFGSWVALFPGTLEPLVGVSYDFQATWGVSRGHFELLTLGTVAVIVALTFVGLALGRRERRRDDPDDVTSGVAGPPAVDVVQSIR